MALATAQTIADVTGISSGKLTAAATRATRASKQVRRRITDDERLYEALYQEIVDRGSGDDAYDLLEAAESLLALYYGLPFMNLYVTDIGGIIRESGHERDKRRTMSASELDVYRGEIYAQYDDTFDDLIEYEGENNDRVSKDLVEQKTERVIYAIG